MKSMYRVGDDIFIAAAFVSFIIGTVLRLMDIKKIALGITPQNIIFFAIICLLFSISLSLYDLNQGGK